MLALFGIAQLDYDDGLVRVFQSDSDSFAAFQDFSATFAGHGTDVFLLIEAETLAQPDAFVAFHDFVLELQFLEGAEAVVSAFSVPVPAADGSNRGLGASLPRTVAATEAYFADAFARQPALERFLTKNGDAALVIVQTDEAGGAALRPAIENLAHGMLAEQAISVTQTGYGAVREGLTDKLFNDFIRLNAVGAVAGTIVAAFALRSLTLAALTALASGTALLWVLGFMGAMGAQINVISVALPVLILVLSFADALHLSFETGTGVRGGHAGAVARAVRRVGPACILASVTTAIAFGVLMLSPSALIAELGATGAVAAVLSVLAVLIVHPMLYATLDRIKPLASVFPDATERGRFSLLLVLPRLACRLPRMVSAGGGVALVATIGLYLSVQPNFSLYENTSADDPARAAMVRISDFFGPTGALHFAIPLDPAQSGRDLSVAQSVLERHAEGNPVFSLARLGDDIDQIPQALRQRWLTDDRSTGVVSLGFSYRDAASTRALADTVEARLHADQTAGALVGVQATGLELMTSVVSEDMLRDLNRCFLAAVGISGVLIAVWLRDPVAGLVALVPNVLPIALVGAWLVISGRGLEFSSGIALTIAFGLAIDDTVHVLNRLRLNLGGTVWGSRADTLQAVQQVLPALVITSAVLSFGLLGTQIATLPTVAYFGALSIAVFVLALVADLLVLPACLLVAAGWMKRRGTA